MNNEHPSQRLRSTMEGVAPYPKGVLPVPEPIRGTAFFPGGKGLYEEKGTPPFPVGKTMVLAVFPELYAIVAFAAAFIINSGL